MPFGAGPLVEAGSPDMDIVTSEKRSSMMSGIRGRDTQPELRVRQVAHRLGLRFRLNRRDLPGSPDLVLPGRGKVVFVHGCFWHSHGGCKYAYKPKSNVEFWSNKLQKNINRDIRVKRELEIEGWDVVVIWECETRDERRLAGILNRKICNATSGAYRNTAREG
jgi:DNA mismatch endonuclease (patch repair protein)